MTTTYLDKEVVLKALYDDDGKERQYEYCSELKERIEHGEFDARAVSRTFTEAYQAGIYTAKKALADKDAEIADLEKKNIGAHEIIKEKHAEIERLIEKYNEAKAAPHYPDGPWDKLHKAVAENRNLRDRIADLEKLCDMQKATIDQQGIEIEQKNKILQSRMDEIGELYEKIRAQDQDQEYLKKMLQCANDGLEQTAQKEPELFVCPFGKECRNGGCYHKEPHPKEHKCTIKCARYDTFDIKCIPVKEPVLQPSPVPTSGTGTAPQVARFLDILNKKGVSAEYNDEDRKKLGEAIWEAFGFTKERNPGMAKDIGNLTLRVDLIESRQKHDFRQITALETALKALQEEVKTIPNKATCSK